MLDILCVFLERVFVTCFWNSFTFTKLKSISGSILLSPKLAEISLLALIFMMRQLISYMRVPDGQWLDKSISNLKRFYLWPVPYGSQAAQLLIRLQKERVSPGYALLQKVWRECRLPEVYVLTLWILYSVHSDFVLLGFYRF